MIINKRGLFWFRNDLRLEDNPTLNSLCNSCDEVAFVYILDPELLQPTQLSKSRLGNARWQFIKESLADLQQQLKNYKQQLIVKVGKPSEVIKHLIDTHEINQIGVTPLSGVYEKRDIELIKTSLKDKLTWHEKESFTLFDQNELPFRIDDLAEGFTSFRKQIEKTIKPIQISKKVDTKPNCLSKQIKNIESDQLPIIPKFVSPITNMIHKGGETAAREQLDFYCHQSKNLSKYKETRNGLDGWSFSSKLSSYLAQGCISPRQVMQTVIDYEQQFGANQSTYWLYFELLWREFYQWYQEKYGADLYLKRGIKDIDPQLDFNESDFNKWKQGETKSDFINAFMSQINQTGWMSNRGRQIVASYFVNQLHLDWRYGAAWFEQQLVDYDPSSNWGNWQYLAGVGADPRGSRRFNLEKQTQTYDPDGEFIRAWRGEASSQLIDSVDAADWPIYPGKTD